jgi:hypothetical protein
VALGNDIDGTRRFSNLAVPALRQRTLCGKLAL